MIVEKSNSYFIFNRFSGDFFPISADCIIPAAGFSSRMEGQWKAELLTREGLSFIEKALETGAVCKKRILVGGYNFERLKTLIPRDFTGRVLENPDFAKGMLSTIQKALPYVDSPFFIFPMDMPLIGPEHFLRLWQVFRDANCGKSIIRPSFQGQPGHPVLFSECWKKPLLKGTGKSPSKLIPREEILFIPWEDDSVLLDVDTPQAFYNYKNYNDKEGFLQKKVRKSGR